MTFSPACGTVASLCRDRRVDKALGSGQDPQPRSECLYSVPPVREATVSPLSEVLGRGYLRTSLGVSTPQVLGRGGEKESLPVPGAQAQLAMRKERGFKEDVSLQFPGLNFA